MPVARTVLSPKMLMSVLATSFALGAGHPGTDRFVATTGHPIAIPLVAGDRTNAASTRYRYVDLAVKGFTPSSTGPVVIVAEVECGSRSVEVGRFGIYPERPFSATEPDRVQRFSLTIPSGIRLTEANRLTLRVVPGIGSGVGAAIDVEAGQLR